ncbi:MAG: adenosine kinase [Bacteroidales bacterium]|nr:adenosine kinase [Bacteroidales bacterium]
MKRIIGIGNALVDIMIKVPGDEILSKLSLPKGSMQLVDSERSANVREGSGNHEHSISAGGSVANTIHALGLLGASPGYIGSIGDDTTGEYFTNDLKAAGVDTIMFHRKCATGTAVALVTPDSERTFATHLGAAIELNNSEINAGLLKGYDILYIEGYLISNFELVKRLGEIAKSLGMEVALDLSSYNVVEENRERFEEIVTGYTDILFANEDEAKAFTGRDAEEALEILSGKCNIAVVKTGSRGSMIKRGEEIIRVGVIPVTPVDSTGAGDMYAAGFLYGYANDEPLDRCGAYGALLAGSVLEFMGAKMPEEKWNELKSGLRSE